MGTRTRHNYDVFFFRFYYSIYPSEENWHRIITELKKNVITIFCDISCQLNNMDSV